MKRTLQPLLFLTSMVLAVPAHAHNLIPGGWCIGGSPQLILEVSFGRNELIQYKNTHAYIDPATGKPCTDRSICGIVDDWHWATQIMNEAIPAFANQRQAGPRSATASVVAVATTADYNDRTQHHALYTFDDGLTVRYLGCVLTNNSPE